MTNEKRNDWHLRIRFEKGSSIYSVIQTVREFWWEECVETRDGGMQRRIQSKSEWEKWVNEWKEFPWTHIPFSRDRWFVTFPFCRSFRLCHEMRDGMIDRKQFQLCVIDRGNTDKRRDMVRQRQKLKIGLWSFVSTWCAWEKHVSGCVFM